MDMYFPTKSAKNILPRISIQARRSPDSTVFRTDRSHSDFRTTFNPSDRELKSILKKGNLHKDDQLLLKEHMKKNEKIVEIRILEEHGTFKPVGSRLPIDKLPTISPQKAAVKTEPRSDSVSSDPDMGKENDEELDPFEYDSEDNDDEPTEIKQYLNRELQLEINNIKHRITKDLGKSFFRYIKMQEKLKDIAENFTTRRESLNPVYYYCREDHLFPKRIDLSNCLIDRKEVNFSDLGVGERYFPIIKNLLQSSKCQQVKQLYLCSNRLDAYKLRMFIDSFPLSVKVLNISNNDLGRNGAKLLADNFSNLVNLKSLDLANNNLTEIGAQIVLLSLTKNQTVAKLNLSENLISDAVAPALHQFLQQNCGVEVLQISWNQIGPAAGIMLARGLMQNRSIKVLDLSYNRLGLNDQINCIHAWCEAILSNSFSLIHLDISYNQLSEKQLRTLNQALIKDNHIYGLHVEGNKCAAYIDPYGFMQFDNFSDNLKQVQRKKHQIDGVNYIPISGEITIGSDCCWICQGWMEHRFVYTPEASSEQVPIFLHLDFLDYKPIPMTSSYELRQQYQLQMKQKSSLVDITTGEIIHQLKHIVQQEKKITMAAIEEAYQIEKERFKEDAVLLEDFNKFYYTTYQMCPPKRRILYFFSNPMREEFFIDPNALNMSSPLDDLVLQGKDPRHSFHHFCDGTQLPFRRIGSVNYLLSKQEYVIDDKNNYKPLIKIYPRSAEKKYVLRRFANNSLRKKVNLIVWNKEDSTFRQYAGDTEDVLNEAFEFDWNCSKIPRFVKNEYERTKLKENFRNAYQLIKDVYKFYSSIGYQPPDFEYFCIQFPQFVKLIQMMGLLDGEGLKMQDVELDLASIKNNIDQKIIYNPDKALIRYQFMEMFFRMANDKYIRTGVCKNYADAVYRIFKETEQYFEFFDKIHDWRVLRLWTKECDQLLTFKNQFIKKLYEYATDIAKRKWYFKLKWITIKEFQEFCKQCGLSEYFSEKQLAIIYNFSMQTQVDEVSQDRNIRMSQIEFVEALARLAERLSPAPVQEQAEKWTQHQRQLLPLHIKLEATLTYMFYRLRNKDPAFNNYPDLFIELPEPQGIKLSFMPKPMEKLKRKEEELVNSTSLTIYNTVSFLNNNKQAYLHPNYKKFLQQSFSLTQPAFGGVQPLINPRKSRPTQLKNEQRLPDPIQ